MKWIWLMQALPAFGAQEFQSRIWAAHGPSRVTGEFCRELLGGVQIRDTNGKTRLIRMEQLSASDISYLSCHVAPEISVSVDYSSRKWIKTEWSRPDDDVFFYTFTVKLQKRSKLPYKRQLTAELFVIGDERVIDGDEHLVLMDRCKTTFVFAAEKKSCYEFRTSEIPFPFFRSHWILAPSAANRGKTYRGWILVITDEQNRLVVCQHDIDVRWITDDLEGSIEKLRNLYVEHSGSKESRHFNSAFKKLEPPRIPWFRRNRTY